MNKVRAILIYYGQVFVLNTICSLFACKTIHNYGLESFPTVLGLKFITLLLGLYFNNVYRGKEIYFYCNIGLRRELIWGSIIVVDIVIFLAILFLFFEPK